MTTPTNPGTELPEISAGDFRRVLGHFPTGVCVITASPTDGGPVGMAVSSFTSVSLDPPLVAFFPDKRSSTWPKIAEAGHFCVNILAEDQQWLCRQFASKAEDKFADVPFTQSGTGAPQLEGVVGLIDCDLQDVFEAGDHYIAIGRIRALHADSDRSPLLFFQSGYGSFTALPV